MLRALCRYIPNSFVNALAMTAPETPIDVALARRQHLQYRDALAECGVAITTIPGDEACPDCVFVEDTAVIVGHVALVTRPGAVSRQTEPVEIARALDAWCRVIRMEAPATLDGGDVMQLGNTIYVGRSARTNAAGIAMLEQTFRSRVVAVELPPHVLHLKCVVSPLDHDTVLLAEGSLPPALFAGFRIISVPREETYAANAVAVGSHVVVAQEFPRTHDALSAAGFTLHPVPTSEVRKADGSLTCQSLVF
ncbi:MAG: dimethylargininase [Myxococcales bacterium]|nr:dimethylargininase [Myxococcales bacterium]